MARYTGPVCRLCRREGKKLYLKGDRCVSGKCALDRRNTAPGQHGAATKKLKEYGKQTREKQFVNYYEEAARQQGMTGENLLKLLERRYDNVVYRMGMASSRKEARQLVLHGHFTINGKKANIPSILVRSGDVIAVAENFKKSEKCKALAETLETKTSPKWLEVDKANFVAKVVALPEREDIDFPFEEQLIVELYSK